MENVLPLYNATIDRYDSETGMYCISLVEYPATELQWQLFKSDEKPVRYTFSEDNEEKVIRTVVMLADTPIYRRDGDYEYLIQFSKDTLKLMAEKFLAFGYPNQFNIEHNPSTFAPGIFIREMFIKDTEKGINPTGFESVPEGSLFATAKVTNDEIWNRIKAGEWSGFSLEGIFNIEKEEEDPEEAEIMSLIEKIKNKIK